jgi:hypothetical protein
MLVVALGQRASRLQQVAAEAVHDAREVDDASEDAVVIDDLPERLLLEGVVF